MKEFRPLLVVGAVVGGIYLYNRYLRNKEAAEKLAGQAVESGVAEETPSQFASFGALDRSISAGIKPIEGGRARKRRRTRGRGVFGGGRPMGKVYKKKCQDDSTVPPTVSYVSIGQPCPQGFRDTRKAVTA